MAKKENQNRIEIGDFTVIRAPKEKYDDKEHMYEYQIYIKTETGLKQLVARIDSTRGTVITKPKEAADLFREIGLTEQEIDTLNRISARSRDGAKGLDNKRNSQKKDRDSKPTVVQEKAHDANRRQAQTADNLAQNRNLELFNMNVIKRFLPNANDYSEIGVNSSREIWGLNKKTGEYEPVSGLRTKSMGTDKEIHGQEKNGKHTHKNVEKILVIESNPRFGFAIDDDVGVKGNRNVEIVSFSKDQNKKDGIAFYDLNVLRSQGRTGERRLRLETGLNEGTYAGKNADRNMDIRDEIGKENSVPDEIKDNFKEGIESHDELITDPSKLKQILIDAIEQTLDKKYGQATPGQHRAIAEGMATEIVDERRKVKDVFEEKFGSGHEKEVEEDIEHKHGHGAQN